jgi:uncharacterized iron-regulated membrane protein
MHSQSLRKWIFVLHRYLGLAVGLIAVIVGLTGSLLVFHTEIDQLGAAQTFGRVVPQGDRLPLTALVNQVKTAYADQPDYKIDRIYPYGSHTNDPRIDLPISVSVVDSQEKSINVLLDPYTGELLSTQSWDKGFFDWVYRLHYALLMGNIGIYIVGGIAFLMVVLALTGIVLWPGWRRLVTGFKIKWNAHPKRLNFDLHKVTGIILGGFFSMIALTGVWWNFYEYINPALYAAISIPNPKDPVIQAIPGKTSITDIDAVLQTADTVLPDFPTIYVVLPTKPESVFSVRKASPSSRFWDSQVHIDPYSGKVLRVDDGTKLPWFMRLYNYTAELHYGTFGGLLTRILYIFVGLSPLILFTTGLMMWRYRQQPKTTEPSRELAQQR